ncbi:TPA: hypothetical protein RQN23_002938 [Aeromonas veronii]|nr:hypothetical protein [Aeromonas veronii]
MLLSDWILSKKNEGLTLKAAKWVIANALSIPSQQLTEICRHADHPILQDETLFDDVPNEVRALFVSTPLLPRKYVNGTFAWLFGKNSINEIDANSLEFHEKLTSEHPRYSLNHKLETVPFTKDEYDHLYSSFYVEKYIPTDTTLGRFLSSLHRHQHISAETFIRLAEQGSHLQLNENVSEEVAKLCFSREVEKNRRKFNHPNSGSSAGLFLSCISALKLKNLKQDVRDTIITTFGIENFKHEEVFRVYNGNIPDSIMAKMFEIGSISLVQHKDLIIDERIPLEMASKVAFYYDDLLCSGYLKRSDLTKDIRIEFLSEMKAKNNSDGKLTYTYINNMTKLIADGVLTLAEIEYFECDEIKKHDNAAIFKWALKTGNDIPTEMQDRWIDSSGSIFPRFNKDQLQVYWDIPKIISLINRHYIEGKAGSNPLGSQYEEPKDVIPYLFQNKGWTAELLLDLLKVCNQAPAVPVVFKRGLNNLREAALCKLFSESIYPALTDHPHCDGEGKYGRTEKVLAYLLKSNHDMLSQCDIDLIVHSNLHFDYKDDDIDLADELIKHPDLHGAVVAEKLKKRLTQIGDDSPTPMTSRKSNHL